MNTSEAINSSARQASTARGLRYARIAGYLMSAILLALGVMALVKEPDPGAFEIFKGFYFMIYAFVLSLPFGRMSDKIWRKLYGLLVVMSVLFVFVIIAVVMFAYMASAERGERLGVPGFEGTLIFLALLQVPVLLFQRKPDLLD